MTTKDQERKALEQIRKIVEGLGDDSYIGTAFEGCFEIAESNITNDFACSMKDRAETAEHEVECLNKKINKLQEELTEDQKKFDGWRALCQKKQDEIVGLWKKEDELREALKAEQEKNMNADVGNGLKDDEIAGLKDEIIKLKAKLYDMIVKED